MGRFRPKFGKAHFDSFEKSVRSLAEALAVGTC